MKQTYRHFKRVVYTILFLLIFPLFSFSQQTLLTGTVIDEVDEPLPGVNIVIIEQYKEQSPILMEITILQYQLMQL